MAATLTVTGTAGAGVTLTSQVYSGVTSFTIDAVNNLVSMTLSDSRVFTVSVAAATTVTATKSGSTWTMTIS
jgi:hypothetical protein